jgi:hypothetical protein
MREFIGRKSGIRKGTWSNRSFIYIYIKNIYAQNRCLAVGWNCLKLGFCHDFWKFPMEKCGETPSDDTLIFFLCFTTSSVALLPWRRLIEIVLLSLLCNLFFYRQSLRSGLLSVLAADASLRRQAPEYFLGFFEVERKRRNITDVLNIKPKKSQERNITYVLT